MIVHGLGTPMCRNVDNTVIWKCSDNSTRVISTDEAAYLCQVGLGLMDPDINRINGILRK